MQNEFLLHWLTFTVWEDPKRAFWLVFRLLGIEDILPSDFFVLAGSGGRGYTEIWQSSEAVRIYSMPNDGTVRYTVEIPGEVLQTVSFETLQTVFQELNLQGIRWQVARCDYAFDLHLSDMTPKGLYDYLRMGGKLVSASKRESVKFVTPVYSEQGSTLSLGSRSSERFVRIYDKRGYTRVELETKSHRANLLFRVLLLASPVKWSDVALSFLLDFVDFSENTFWIEFRRGVVKAGIIVKTHESMSVHRALDWVNKQVSPTLYMLAELYGIGAVSSMVLNASDRLSSRQEKIIKLRPVLTFF